MFTEIIDKINSKKSISKEQIEVVLDYLSETPMDELASDSDFLCFYDELKDREGYIVSNYPSLYEIIKIIELKIASKYIDYKSHKSRIFEILECENEERKARFEELLGFFDKAFLNDNIKYDKKIKNLYKYIDKWGKNYYYDDNKYYKNNWMD